ncbi:MAG: hypothetical protein GW942_02040 [Candidatus Pacebacteria bacterium]|nr:hypothetical protein [Candidatus Paceibacterota bacterium]PIQ81439.1 MAG: hypothetical protein COV78_00225 [Candidatus Pacebacteria bacterium CG11_big_fil_rev_8_21_14_0_20_34_55]PIX81748.1 MAG: hypothetical protein COZ34_01660 [Candidatus Pacebacteria bacterium CG_4_10_14_3_um_filter_34_15]PJC43689.1 MAG: hypothetical protein CO039_02750 [Candidatus Pacebacteria bacterium CG_4_9_14_0_2_um_filter_34_50]
MQKETSFIVKFIGNLNKLVPFIGFLLVIAGILGLVFVQKPISETQELRSDASEDQELWPKISADLPDQTFFVDKISQIALNLNSQNATIKKINVVFNIINDDLEDLIVTVDAASGLRAETVEVEETEDGYLVNVLAVKSNPNDQVELNNDTFIKIEFTPKSEGNISINFDEDNTYIVTPSLAYVIEAQTINFDIKTKQDDEDNQDQEEIIIKDCNQSCSSNADCAVNFRCFNTGSGNKCRLATNPSSSNCSSPPDLGPNKQCNQECANSKECAQGLSCWNGACRNPSNVENTSCANQTAQEKEMSVNSCGESCSSNADCAINLRCYQSACRLTTNPSSLTCSAYTEKKVSKIYDQASVSEDASGSADTKEIIEPIKKGDNMIPNSELNFEQVGEDKLNSRTNSVLNDDAPVDETAFDFLVKMLKDKQQGLPTKVILIGVGLLAASLLVLLIARLLSAKPKSQAIEQPERLITHNVIDQDPDHTKVFRSTRNTAVPSGTENLVSLEQAKDARIKELMKKLDGQSKNQNQG